MSTEDAIQTDVAEVKDEVKESNLELVPDKKETLDLDVKTDRNDIMDMIVKKRSEELAKDMDLEVEDPDLSKDEEPETVAAEPDPEPAEEKVVVKVDGVESTVTAEEIRNYQINKAADKRLEEANRLLKEAQEKKVAAEAAAAAKPVGPTIDPEKDMDTSALAEDLIQSVFQEDKDKVAKILSNLTSTQPAGQPAEVVTPETISAAVAAELRKEKEAAKMAEQAKAVAKFQSEYKELNDNPVLRAAVDQQTIFEQEKDPTADTWTIIDRAARHVDSLFNKKPSKSAETADRTARKRSAGAPVKPVAAAASIKKKEKPQLSAFEQIQQSRGQG